MWGLFVNYLRLFFKGKLFRDPRAVLRQWLIGVACAIVALVLLVEIGVPLWLGVVLAAAGSGGLQPFLFRNLKYA